MGKSSEHSDRTEPGASQRYCQILVENSDDFVFVLDSGFRYEFVNRKAANVVGRDTGEIIGCEWTEFFPEDQFPDQLATLRRVLASGEPEAVVSLVTIDRLGRKAWLSTELTPILDDTGKVVSIIGISRDVTGQKVAELELAASEARYRLLSEAALDIIFTIDRDGYVSYVNNHGAKMFGTSPDRIVGRKMADLFPADIAERQGASIATVIDSARPLYAETKVVMPLGEMWLGTSLSPITDDGGRVTAVLGIARNITDKKNAEFELLQERDFSDAAINSMPGIFYLTSKDGRFLRWNQLFEDISGYSAEELAELSPLEFFAGDDRDLIAGRIQDVFAEGEAEAEADFVNRQGVATRFFFTGYRMIVEDEPYLVGVGTDISELRRAESELTIEKDRAQMYLDSTPAMILVLNPNGTIRLLNQKGCEVLGCEADEVIGKDWFDSFVPEEERQEARDIFGQLLAGEIQRLDYRDNTVVASGGRKKIVSWHNEVILDEAGSVNSVLIAGEDITERRNAERMLRESEQRFKTMFDTAANGILLADPESKRFVLANDTICGMLGYSHDEITRLGVGDIHPAEALPKVVDAFERQARGELRLARDLPVKRKDGSVFFADISSVTVTLSGVRYLMGYFTDATERHLAEAAFIESEERYRTIFEESNDAIFISTPDGRFVDINPAGVRLFGYPSREAIMEVNIINDLYADAAEGEQYLEQLQRNGSVKDYEVRLRRKSGEELFVSVSSKAIMDSDGEMSLIRGTMRDITEQRRLESQLIQAQKMESIGNLAGGVAHDFNNYLTAIQGYADLALLEQHGEGIMQEYLSEIKSSSERAADLTRQLLLFGRREEVNLRPLDLADTIANLQKMLGRLIGERFSIVTRVAANLEMVLADKGLIEQVLVNLVVNSRDAMPGGGEIVLEADNVDATGLITGKDKEPAARYVLLRVRDSGSGIDSETVNHIFEPFFTTKDVGKGTGLGLSVVYGIILQHGGEVEVESELGQGTVFNIYLPAAISDAGQPQDELPPPATGEVKGGASILLVEDDDSVRGLAKRMLDESGFNVVVTASVAEAEAAFSAARGDFKVVFSDVVLPDGNGMDLVQGFIKRNPDLAIVLASGYTGDQATRADMDEQGFIFLQKPYRLPELVSVVSDLVGK
ncbi:MAG: PAS domain-containing sensor histidine kinase [Thermoleophilia bacterium]